MRRDANELHPSWQKRTIVVPPETRDEWVRLVTWELWMGLNLFFFVAIGITLLTISPDRGVLIVAFSVAGGVMLLALAVWVLWSLWSAAAPAPIADDFLRLLKESFGYDWRDPMTWPWSRFSWAYGFTTLGVTIGLLLTMALSASMRSLPSPRTPATQVETLQVFTAQ